MSVLRARKFDRGSDCWNKPLGYLPLAIKTVVKGKSPCVGKHVLRFTRQLEPSEKNSGGREGYPDGRINNCEKGGGRGELILERAVGGRPAPFG